MKFDRHSISRAVHYLKHPRNIVSSKITLYVISAVALFFAYQTAQVMIKRHQTENDIQTFEKQVTQLQGTQGRLQELNQFLETDFFAEKEARLKLGMQKPGEEVVVLSGNNATSQKESSTPDIAPAPTQRLGKESLVAPSTQGLTTAPKQKSNPSKWWDYFFAPDTQ